MDAGILLDPGYIAGVQQISPPVTDLVVLGTFLDTMPWYFLILCLVTFGLHPRYGVRLTTLFGLNSALNEAVKLACHLPRPYWVSEAVTAFSPHGSFGFPSGAAMSGAVMYGYIATIARRFWVLPACILLLLATSAVRIFSGIHFVLDIVGGWALGFLLLAAFLLALPPAEEYAARLSRPARLVLFALVAALPLLLSLAAFAALAGWQVPAAWADLALRQSGAAINPVRIQFSWGASGIIFGGLCGYDLLRTRGGWNPPQDLRRRGAVVVAGTGAVLLLNALLPVLWKAIGLTARVPELATFLSMALVTFFMLACVPLLAARAGVREQDPALPIAICNR
jgi:membrane-associated phospholipid phosphatase